ncbi:MAG TPA: hypothetical protein VN816_08275 [Acidimicrobiales bacterium]|nr:hypothetical protein [Acidimicrobiales bacterium]
MGRWVGVAALAGSAGLGGALGAVTPASALTSVVVWTPTTTPTTGLAPGAGTNPKVDLKNISCPATGVCVAVGDYTDSSGNLDGLVETLSAGTWTATTAPTTGLSPASRNNAAVILTGVSCPSAGTCVAVGYYDDASGIAHGLIESLSSGTWTATTAPITGLSPAAGSDPAHSGQLLESVSCPAAGTCVAAGSYTDTSADDQGMFESLAGGTWTAATAPLGGLSPAAGTNPEVQFAGVSCPVSGTCVASGVYVDSSGNDQGLIESLAGGTWTATTAPTSGLSPSAATSPQLNLGGVSCPVAGSCVAVGGYSDTSGNRDVLTETLSGGTWTALTVPTAGLSPAAGTDLPAPALGNLSCLSATACVAVGFYVDTTDAGHAMVETLSGATWTASTAPDGALGNKPGADLRGVSCPAADACVAVGNYTNSLGDQQGLIETQSSTTPQPGTGGYWEVASDGGIFTFDAPFDNSMGGHPLDAPVVGMAEDPCTGGYWEVASDGGIFSFDAPFYGSMGGQHLDAPVVGMAAYQNASGCGYWEVASDGGIFSFHAPFQGSMGGKPLNKPVVGMAEDPATGGYWEVASDGGIFTFGSSFYGSMGGKPLNKPVVAMAADPATGGYWEVASDGGIFTFDAPFYSSMGGHLLDAPVVGMAADGTTGGYWEVASDGGIFSFNAPFDGSMGGKTLDKPMVGMSADV